MSRLDWMAVGERFYETGIDRGVLYIDDRPGVAWHGLTQVSERTASTDPQQYYFDGVNYLNVSGKEEFKATLSAFYSPEEFDSCDGSTTITRGFSATQQHRKTFGLSYRTRIGNDINGSDHSYKIHLVYNALASPSERNHTSIGEDTEASQLSWDLTTKPHRMNGVVPTAHFVIDASKMHPLQLEVVENILYGSEDNDPRLLTPNEMLDLLESNYQVIEATNYMLDPSFEYGFGGFIERPGATDYATLSRVTSNPHSGTNYLSLTSNVANATYNAICGNVFTETKVDQLYTLSAWVYVPMANTGLRGGIGMGGNATTSLKAIHYSQKGVWHRISVEQITDESADLDVILIGSEVVGEIVYFDDVQLTEGPLVPDFNGDTPLSEQVEPFGIRKHVWAGTKGNSYSHRVVSFGSVTKVNLYPDPSHEYGIAPFDSNLNLGTGTVDLDSLDKHSGSHSIKITNTYPSTVLTENLMPDPSFTYGRGGWHAFGAGSCTQVDNPDGARTGTKVLEIWNDSEPAMADIDVEIPFMKRNTQYTVSAWVNNMGAGTTDEDIHFRYQCTDNGVVKRTDGTPLRLNGWYRISLTFTTGGPTSEGTDDIYLRTPAAGGGRFYVDDISLIEGPPQPITSKDIRYKGRNDIIPVNQGIASWPGGYLTEKSQIFRLWFGDLEDYDPLAPGFKERDVSGDYVANTTHVSAPYIKGTTIYAPIHNLPHAVIGMWDFFTLNWIGQIDVSTAPDSASSSLTWDPVVNEWIMTGYYQDELSIQRYDVDFNYLGYIPTTITFPQGILYFDNKYYINGDCPALASAENTRGRGLISINRDGSDLQMIISDNIQEMEGICVGRRGNFVRAVRDNNAFFIKDYEVLGPNFSGDTAGDKANSIYEWSGTPGASSSKRFRQGSDPGSTELNMPTMLELGLRNGQQFVWSAWVKIAAGVDMPVDIMRLSGPATTGVMAIKTPSTRNEWVKVSGTATIADENQTGIWTVFAGNNSGDIVRYDDFTIELGSSSEDFNGDTLSEPYNGNQRYIYRWRGLPGQSPSEKILAQI